MCVIDVSYHIAVMTGSISGASSDSKVFVKLYGEKGDTNKILLVASDTSHNNYFETGQTDIFTVETIDLGKVNFHTDIFGDSYNDSYNYILNLLTVRSVPFCFLLNFF